MECRSFEVTIISATNLPDVREFGRMKVYAKVSAKGLIHSESIKTHVDMDGGVNPFWNYKINFHLPEEALRRVNKDLLVIKLYCKRSLLDDKYIGEVNLYLSKLFDHRNLCGEFVEFDVDSDKSNGPIGKLKISFSFGNHVVVIQKSSELLKQLKEGASAFTGGLLKEVLESVLPGSNINVVLVNE